MKKLVFLLGVLLSLGMFCACSSDDEDVIPQSEEIKESEADSMSGKIRINCSLLNDSGEEVSSFNYGDDICFELRVVNNSEKVLFFFDDIVFIGGALFRVYSAEGKDMGTPWTSIGKEYIAVGIEPNTTSRLICKWIAPISDRPLEKNKENSPLPKGDYYTSFKIKYTNLENIAQDVFLEKEFRIAFTVL